MASGRKRIFLGLMWVGLIAALPIIGFSVITYPVPKGGEAIISEPALPEILQSVAVENTQVSQASLSAVLSNSDVSTDDQNVIVKRRTDEEVLEKYRKILAELGDPPELDPPLEAGWTDVNEYFLVARAWFLGEETSDAVVSLLTSPDYEVRMAAVQGLIDADADGDVLYIDWRAVGASLGGEDSVAELMTPTIIEALHDETELVDKANIPMLLSYIPHTREMSRPHLIWFAKTAEEPQVRVFAMNAVQRLDPQGDESLDLFYYQMKDRTGHVRLNALQGLFFRGIGNAVR